MLHIQFSVQALEIVWFYSHGQGCFDKIIAMHSTQDKVRCIIGLFIKMMEFIGT